MSTAQQADDLINFDLPDTTPPENIIRDPKQYYTPSKPDRSFPANPELFNLKDPFCRLVNYFSEEDLTAMSKEYTEENIDGMKSDFKYNCIAITSYLHRMNLNKIESAEMYQTIFPYVTENIRLYQAICWLTYSLYHFPKPEEAFCGLVQWEERASMDDYEMYFLATFDAAFQVGSAHEAEFNFDSAEDFIRYWQVLFNLDYSGLTDYLPPKPNKTPQINVFKEHV